MTAVYYGLIDILPNEPLRPEEAATREFAAYTLNKCMGYLLEEGEAYTYTEAETVAYPDDIQIAINRGWFALSDGAFLPEQAVTVEEQAVMLADAEAYVASMTFDSEHYNDYKFLDDVIVIYSAAEVTASEETTELKFENLSKEVAAGDKFVIYQQGLAVPYRAVSVETEGTTTTITATELDFSEAIESMDVQTSVDASPENFYTAEDAELDFFNESTGEVYANAEAAIRAKKANPLAVIIPKFTTKVSVGGSTLSVSVELKNPKVFTDVSLGVTKASASIWLDTDAEITGKLTCEPEEALLEIPVGGYSIPGVGGLDIVVKFDISGSITVVQKCHMEVGVTVGYEVGFLSAKKTQSMIFKVKDKGSSINAEMSAKLYLEAKFGLYGKAMPIKGYFYGEVGFQANVKYTTYSEIEGNCVHFAAFLYAEYGIKVEYDLLIFENSLDWHQEPINEDNSPVKVSCHYEDGVHVASCTRKHLSGTTTGGYSGIGDSGYTTKSGSSYSGSGIGSKTSSSGYNSTGEPVIIYSYSLDEDGNATITKYSGNAVTLTIPQYLDGHPVVAIGDGAFKSKNGITTVILQDNILRIGTNAFEGCQFLRSVTLSENLISIATGAFRNCTLLASIRIPDTVTDIGDHAFSGCVSLQSVILSKNLVSLGGAAFENCDALTSIKIPKSLDTTTKWDWSSQWGVFKNCDGLKKVTFEEGTTQIPVYLFAYCPGLERIEIPDTVTVIEERAFDSCVNLSEVKFSSSLTAIHSHAFVKCTSLTAVEIPDTVTDIGDHAFSGCSALASVSLSKGLISLGGGAFEDCDALTSVEIPKSLDITTKWDWNSQWGVFKNCDGLKTVTFEEGTTQIVSFLFAYCPGLERIEIPDTVTVIEERAFDSCKNLTEVKLSSSLTVIHVYAFASCTSLISVEIPNTVTDIGDHAFAGCSALESVSLSKGLVNLGGGAFEDCDALTSIEIPKSLDVTTKWDWNSQWGVFKNCDGLKTVTFEEGVTQIPIYLFANCPGLESIVIPDTVEIIEQDAFYNCINLQTVTIPDSVTEIHTSAFKQTGLLTVTVPESVVSIGTSVFEGCPNLAS
ncbi:MAG: leucine-rich repeat domain-containing protein, partial [Clostridia bacterium]|nr:leucine-rich repeat domain-containing protein [Clostridia bacterium]